MLLHTVCQRKANISISNNANPQTGQVPKVAVGAGLSAVSIARTLGAAAGNIIVNAPAGLQSGPFAAINKRISQATLPTTIVSKPVECVKVLDWAKRMSIQFQICSFLSSN